MARRKLIMSGMAVVLILSILVACSAPTQTGTTSIPKPVTKVFKVGLSGPMGFDNGKLALAGAKLAADEINAAGGFKAGNDTYTIELVSADSNEMASVPDAVSAMDKLMTVDKVNLVIAGNNSEAVMAQQEVMADNKIIMLDHGAGADQLNTRLHDNYSRYKYWFRFFPGSSSYMLTPLLASLQVACETVQSQLGIQKPKVALLIEKALWTEPFIKLFPPIIEKMGYENVGIWQPSPKATDLTTELTAIKQSGAQVMMLIMAGSASIPLATQYQQLKIPVAIAGSTAAANNSSYWQATGGCKYFPVQSWICRTPMTDKTISFWDKMKASADIPQYDAVGSYDGLYIVADAAGRAGTIETDALISALEKTDYTGVVGRYRLTANDSARPHDVVCGPGGVNILYAQWTDSNPDNWSVFWPNGKELNPAITSIGKLTGWDKVTVQGGKGYMLPDWMVDYWKGQK
ncbi:MAG: ABC transporter substrate-binding protein [Dehalococcoidia bacterium]|jgi:branched-chain amino acid transport system substrate-binding protein